MEKAIYLQLVFGETHPLTPEQEWQVLRVRLAERFGWTFEVIDRLPVTEVYTILAIKAAETKRAEEQRR